MSTPPVSTPLTNKVFTHRSTTGNVQQSHRAASPNDSQPGVNRISDRWADQAVIGVKPVSTERKLESVKVDQSNLLERRALPGLTTSILVPPHGAFKREDKPDRSPTAPLSPDRHVRIPSTGNQATVIDVAPVWNEHRFRKLAASNDLLLGRTLQK